MLLESSHSVRSLDYKLPIGIANVEYLGDSLMSSSMHDWLMHDQDSQHLLRDAELSPAGVELRQQLQEFRL